MGQKFSVIFLGSSGKTIKQIQYSYIKIFFLTLLLISCLGCAGYFFWNYSEISKKNAEILPLKIKLTIQTEEVIHQREQIQKFAYEINELKQQLVQLKEFEERIRVLANVNDANKNEGLFGVGGSAPDDLNPNIELTQRHQRLMKDMHQHIDQLKKATENQQKDFSCLYKTLEIQKNLMAQTPSIRPAKGWVTSRFGYRVSPFTGSREFHEGWDIANHKGTEVIATADGVISFADEKGSFGKLIIIDHGHGITTRYAHLDKTFFKQGDRISRGQIIASMGNTGRSTGPHLHYEVRLNGIPVNPAKYILD